MSIVECAIKLNIPPSTANNIISKFTREGRLTRKRSRASILSDDAIEEIISQKRLIEWQGLTLKERAKLINKKHGINLDGMALRTLYVKFGISFCWKNGLQSWWTSDC